MNTVPGWFAELQDARADVVRAHRRNEFERGFRTAVVEKYAEPTHFVLELLQNAEDQGATSARFLLGPDRIVFEHDGQPFSAADVKGVTGIGNTTKLDQANKIGCFGVGFKSVFMVTDAPEVHALVDGAPLGFAIRDLVVPEIIPFQGAPDTTRIVLPFPEGKAVVTTEMVRETLREAGPGALLFLQHLRQLSWTDGQATESYHAETDAASVRHLRRQGATGDSDEHFMILSRAVGEEEGKALDVKIALRLAPNGDVVRDDRAPKLSVYFETEEVPGLEFRIHGPFALTDNRANIKRNHAWNTKLVGEIATLLVESLPQLRDLGKLNRSLLGVLPHARDELSPIWSPVRDAIVRAFKTQPLTPAQFGGHEPATSLVRGPADLRELVRDEGLAVMRSGAPRRWAISGSPANPREDAFLAGLGIDEWNSAAFLDAVMGSWGLSIPTKISEWMAGLAAPSLQRFYLLLDAAARANGKRAALRHLDLVKTTDGSFVAPPEARLPMLDAPKDDPPDYGDLHIVAAEVLQAARGRAKDVIEVLEGWGTVEVSEDDHVAAIVAKHDAESAGGTANHLRDLRRIIRWWKETGDAEPFEGMAFLRAEDQPGYLTAGQLYLDAPYAASGLAAVYSAPIHGRAPRHPLWSGYATLKRSDLLEFLRACGVEDRLAIERTGLRWDHPLRSQFSSTRQTDTARIDNYQITGLASLLARKDPVISVLVWRAVERMGATCLSAVYRPNRSHDPKSWKSDLATVLSIAAWIPTRDGQLCAPKDVTPERLAPPLSVAGNEAWLRELGFGAEQQRVVERVRQRRSAAKELGLPAGIVDALDALPEERRAQAAADFLERLKASRVPVFPEREAKNPERRARIVAERAADADPKTYEQRTRSVRTSDGDVRKAAKAYLRDHYTNLDGIMVCQACHDAMPFQLADGSHYFEAAACIGTHHRELRENFLALCPTCSAMWLHARETDDATVSDRLLHATSPEIPVRLAGRDIALRFVQVHLLDLKAALGAAPLPPPA